MKNKRESLEQFIREQTLGPGINGYRFVDVEHIDILHENTKNLQPINYTEEIIDSVPAAVYSTGILFPQDDSKTAEDSIELDKSEATDDSDTDKKDVKTLNSEVDESNTVDLDQMYPKIMGFSCCLDKEFLNDEKFEIKLKARYYRKIKRNKDNGFNKKYGVYCDIPAKTIDKFITKFKLKAFSITQINRNSILQINYLSVEELASLRGQIKKIEKELAETIFKDNITIFPKKLTKENCYLSKLLPTIFNQLKYQVTDKNEREILYTLSQKIEVKENILTHLKSLLNINGSGYGLWKAEIIERTISFENISFPEDVRKKSYLHIKHNENITITTGDNLEIGYGLKDIYTNNLNPDNEKAALSMNVQFSRDSRNKRNKNKIYIKVQLINTSPAFKIREDSSRYYSTSNEDVNKKCFFGVKLSIENQHLVSYNKVNIDTKKEKYEEDETTQYLYRQFEDYGVGHGCSVKWDKNINKVETEYLPVCDTPDIDPTPRNKLEEPVKDNEGNFISPLFITDSKAQQFKWLSTFSIASNKEVIDELNDFVDSYKNWIEDKRKNIKIDEEAIAKQELDKCTQDYQRMKNNIKNLLTGGDNDDNLQTFRLMNSAMFMQIWHSVKTKKQDMNIIFEADDFQCFNTAFYQKAEDTLFSETEPAAWRAFQLAFILLNLDGIYESVDNPDWSIRNDYVDLVWFPTGGGKTEAYLGLIALTIIDRRKRHIEKGGGTAAIMRYTLRLLTLQQFQRATLLIMALELIRRWKQFELGEEPIYIGLWVGGSNIPNKLQNTFDKKDSLLSEYEKLNETKPNKVPFNNCPWCNSKLKGDTSIDKNSNNPFQKNKLHLKCINIKCSFSSGKSQQKKTTDVFRGPIPVNLCDESIYEHPPTLLFGTVDKFAQLAHKVSNDTKKRNADSRRLFGVGNWEQGKPQDGYLPPDLIIQDELHLLNGPLGSSVALFESAIDQLCTREDGTRAKVISSTATTRNTGLQIAALFSRKVNLFPKQGVECDDSFFAFYKRTFKDNKDSYIYQSKRRYMGFLPTGKTQIWMQMRLAAITMTHRAIYELKQLGENTPIDYDAYNKHFSKSMDYYHTIISYFNSLREVGKTQSQVQSYILKEVRKVFNRVLRPGKLMHSLYTNEIVESELTGRLSGEDVKNKLKEVENNWNAENRFSHIKDGETQRGIIPPEFVVATNMISVGIDVSRFNLMIMNSMPRNTAEYIQATSRVARDDYGLVLTVHHPFRARDISHYEKFIEFHEKMYSYVEPISITPFTSKSVGRYLGLYIATMVRHKTQFTDRNSSKDIIKLNDLDIENLCNQLTLYFDERIKKNKLFNKEIQNLLKPINLTYIKQWVNEAIEGWKNLAQELDEEDKILVFNNKYKSHKAKQKQEQLYVEIDAYINDIHSTKWQIPMSLRVIEPESAIKINLK